MILYQQGDVLLKTTDIPKKAKQVQDPVLVRSAVTGHTHSVSLQAEVFEYEGKKYIKAKKTFALTHQEHHTLKVPPGEYWVDAVQEYDHFAEEARAVAD